MEYEWDEEKSDANIAADRLGFEAIEDFEWETAMVERSDRHGETRWAATGYIGDRLHRVVYTRRGTCSELMRPWPGRAGGGGVPLIPAFSRQGRRCKRPVAAQGESYQLTEPEQLPDAAIGDASSACARPVQRR